MTYLKKIVKYSKMNIKSLLTRCLVLCKLVLLIVEMKKSCVKNSLFMIILLSKSLLKMAMMMVMFTGVRRHGKESQLLRQRRCRALCESLPRRIISHSWTIHLRKTRYYISQTEKLLHHFSKVCQNIIKISW